ncbi:MAG: autotransporter outer membrane beta-barrel domain-containing protein [Candidatus Sphingomonas phytovorans]|nr:autotransporter outer membrane beta-barrel domain-containing protein [Sphingomonas sp.]WEK01644.1 MAG: autotransporter outer membrane beta-barrel domain-containing protein [Sphingomonas sp.]
MIDRDVAGVRRRSFWLGASVLALGAATASPAWAQCAPDPTVANGTTTCTGIDTNGITVTTPDTTLTVADGASVSNTGAPAVTVEVPNTVSPIVEKIIVAGQITGGSQAGIALLTGESAIYNGSTTRLALTVQEGGSVSGSTALAMGRSGGNVYAQLIATIDNAGTITGSSGVALRGDVVTMVGGYPSPYSAFDSIINGATGVISGSVVGPVGTLNNAGLIDGGNSSAVTSGNAGTDYPYTIHPGAWVNSGTIRSNGAAAAIAGANFATLTNGGVIANTGAGAAVSSAFLNIQNLAGGQISSAGTTAIEGSNGVNLVNRGIITGNVVTGNSGSTVDSSLGRINGSVAFGAGNDTLVVRYGGVPAPITGITGTINAGAGINTEQLAVSTDTTINTPVTLLAGFQQFAIATDQGVTTTLGTGFVAPTNIQVAGSGTLVNRAAITSAGTAFTLNGVTSPALQQVINEGSIHTASSTLNAVVGAQYTRFTNSGSITSAGAGVRSNGSIINSGTITTSGTAVVADGNTLTNAETGVIRSTNGIGVLLRGSQGTTSRNSGTIQGATVGVQLGADLINTGTVKATNSGGTAVQLDAYSTLYNNAGGVVGNGGRAISGNSFVTSVINAGTINGTVALTLNSADFGGYNGQRYISLNGGVLNGDLVLGAGATLFTDLVNTGPGQFAGITGTVTAANGALLRLRVTGTQAATLGPIGSFSNATYEMTNGAHLTLTAPGTFTNSVALAGTGTVDLNANLTTTTATPALAVVGTLADKSNYGAGASALSITSRGTITVTRAVGSTIYSGSAVSLGEGDSFTNLGTIAVTDRNASAYTVGISGGAAITNAGAILLDGGTGISGAIHGTSVVNTGTITQISGGAKATGLTGSISLDNRGTISVGGNAISAYNYNRIINSGIMESTGGIAIGGSDTSASAMILNATGGAITGTGGTAVRLYSGHFVNAGTVNGTVDLGYGYPYYNGAPQRSLASSVFIAAGGTVTGDLLFGDGSDLLLQTGSTLGVSGVVDGGGGNNVYGRVLTSSGTVSIDPAGVRNFQHALVQADGEETVVTATATGTFGGTLYATGNGSVVNQAAITGSLTTNLPDFPPSSIPYGSLFPAEQTLASLTNNGSVRGGVSGSTSLFTNSGAITSTANSYVYSYEPVVSLFGRTTLGFTNSGTIASIGSTVTDGPTVRLYAANAMTIGNSGQIVGRGLMAVIYRANTSPLAMNFTNSGTITSNSDTAAAYLEIVPFGQSDGGTIRIANTGTIAAQSTSSAYGLHLHTGETRQPLSYAITNSGTISASQTPSEGSGTAPIIALFTSGAGQTGTITNAAGGTISATGARAFALVTTDSPLNLTNAGTIAASGSTSSVAIQTYDSFNNMIVNTGTIIGDIVLGAGNDSIDNSGVIKGAVSLGAGDDRLTLRGGAITGLIDGGAGNDSIDIMGGSSAAPVALGSITNIEALRMASGLATISGTASLGDVTLSGGRLIGLAGSTIGAPTINVGAGATFGSAGTVNGNIAVAGTLSPGASPGTMTVNGNVALAASSVSLFEITPAVTDKLVVNGAVSIAPGATLQLAADRPLTPGKSLDLIVASGGISGSYGGVVKSSSLAGYVSIQGGRLTLLGLFLGDVTLSPQAQRAVGYVNDLLISGRASTAFVAAAPQLTNAAGLANSSAFAQLTPEAYASVGQVAVEQGLELADAGRSQAFGTLRDSPGLFSFGSTLGNFRTLSGGTQGASRAQINGYGFLGGVGWGSTDWAIGGFIGYLTSRENLAERGARSTVDSVVAGVHGRWTDGRLGVKATIAYDGGSADTRRTLPGGSARGEYDLRTWTGDLNVDYAVPVGHGWMVRPGLGATVIQVVRDRVMETGGSVYALNVARARDNAVFVDGALTFSRDMRSEARVRPYLSLGLRYQATGRTLDAIAALGGGGYGLVAAGVPRAPLLVTATAGADVRVSEKFVLFGALKGESGNADHRGGVSAGFRMAF